MNIDEMLERVVSEGASDGFISAGACPSIKVDGSLFPIRETPLTAQEARELVLSTMDEEQQSYFMKHHEYNFAIGREGLGRFRVSCFQQRGEAGLVLRRIVTEIPTVDELGLPPILTTSPDYLLKAYGPNHRIIYGTGRITAFDDVQGYAAQLLSRGDVAYVDVRSARNNCFLTRITAAP